MEDLIGLGKGAEKLIDVIAKAVGVIYNPYKIRSEADAKAYEIKIVEAAKTNAKADEMRALAEAKRDELIILDNVTSTLEERAANRKRFDELRRQRNLENVINGAFSHIGSEISQEPIDPDWVQSLIRYAEDANSSQMQELWSKVLAGETELPGSFSLRTLETLKKLSRKDAILFQNACQIASKFQDSEKYMIIESFRATSVLTDKNHKINLQKFGVGLIERMTLCEVGLMHDTYITSSNFTPSGFNIIVAGHPVLIAPKSDKSEWTCYQFTQAGSELYNLLKLGPDGIYYKDFVDKSEFTFSITDSEECNHRKKNT